jgi:serine/threonine protein phosphatase PrpC
MLEASGLSDPGCVRGNNEDSLFLDTQLGLFIVADGMGGAQAGEHASHLATQCVVDRVRSAEIRSADLLRRSVEEANQAVMDAAAKSPRLEGMGTTIVAALAAEPLAEASGTTRIWIASVGDSRAYLQSPSETTRITEDQTWVNEIGRQVLSEEALRSHPMRHVLTMAVGVSQPLRVNSYEVDLKPGSRLLLSSDGLHGVVTEAAMERTLREEADLDKCCQDLIAAAREAGGPDNITAIVISAV